MLPLGRRAALMAVRNSPSRLRAILKYHRVQNFHPEAEQTSCGAQHKAPTPAPPYAPSASIRRTRRSTPFAAPSHPCRYGARSAPRPPARIIHEPFCCNRRFAAATSLSADVPTAQSLNVLFKYVEGPRECTCPSHDTTPRFRDEPSRIMRARCPAKTSARCLMTSRFTRLAKELRLAGNAAAPQDTHSESPACGRQNAPSTLRRP